MCPWLSDWHLSLSAFVSLFPSLPVHACINPFIRENVCACMYVYVLTRMHTCTFLQPDPWNREPCWNLAGILQGPSWILCWNSLLDGALLKPCQNLSRTFCCNLVMEPLGILLARCGDPCSVDAFPESFHQGFSQGTAGKSALAAPTLTSSSSSSSSSSSPWSSWSSSSSSSVLSPSSSSTSAWTSQVQPLHHLHHPHLLNTPFYIPTATLSTSPISIAYKSFCIMYITDLTSIIYEIFLCQLYDLNYLHDLHHAQRCSYVSRQIQYVPTKYQQRHFRWSWLVGDPTSIGSRKLSTRLLHGPTQHRQRRPSFYLSLSWRERQCINAQENPNT